MMMRERRSLGDEGGWPLERDWRAVGQSRGGDGEILENVRELKWKFIKFGFERVGFTMYFVAKFEEIFGVL